MTIDFSGPVLALYEFFYSHLFLKYHQVPKKRQSGQQDPSWHQVGKYPHTVYFGQIRGSFKNRTRANSKAIRMYVKSMVDHRVFRLELILNRGTIKRLGLELPLDDLDEKVDLSKFICFKTFNVDPFVSHIKWRNRGRLEEMNSRGASLLERQLENFPKTRMDLPVMAQVEQIKRSRYSDNSGRFFEDLTEENEALFSRLKNQSFLPD